MKYFVRSPIKTAMEGDFDTGNVRYKARERYSFGVSDPRGIFDHQVLNTLLLILCGGTLIGPFSK